MSKNKQGHPILGFFILVVIFVLFLLIWHYFNFGLAFVMLIAFFMLIVSIRVDESDSAWKIPADENVKKPDYDYRINLNKNKRRYDTEIKSYPKEKVIKPTSPFHPSTHNSVSQFQVSLQQSTPRSRLKKMRDDIVKAKNNFLKTTVTRDDARSRLKAMRDNLAKPNKKATLEDTCSISPEITEQNLYWNYTPNSVELTSKQKGDMFEEYVIHKFDPNYFLLVEMRSDKGSNGIYPESNQYPDQVWRYKPNSYEFAVECKWRFGWWLYQDNKHWIDLMGGDHKLGVYNRFSQQKNMFVWIILGVGGRPNKPNELYVVPLNVLQYRHVERNYLQYFRHHDISKNFNLDISSYILR